MSQLLKKERQVVLPYELEHDIFELAARAFPGHATKLCTLSRYVRLWMESIIYETIVLELPPVTADLFMRTFNSRPPNFFAKHVKRLYITSTGIVTIHDARKLLAACTGAVEVTCWVYPHTLKDNLLHQLPTHSLRRLSIPLETLWGLSPLSIEFTPSLFPNLSHLEIVNPQSIDGPLRIDWESVTTLPSLTHFAVGEFFTGHFPFIPVLQQLLERSAKLEVLIIITRSDVFIEELRKSGLHEDERVVVRSDFNAPFILSEYWDGVRKGGPDFWALVDATARQQKLMRTKQEHENPLNLLPIESTADIPRLEI